jgi:hypothetical protein
MGVNLPSLVHYGAESIPAYRPSHALVGITYMERDAAPVTHGLARVS